MSRFPHKQTAALAALAAIAASTTQLIAQTKPAKTIEDFALEPLSAERLAEFEPLEYDHTISIRPGTTELDIAKTISPEAQPLEATASASATTRLEQGAGSLPSEVAAGTTATSDVSDTAVVPELPTVLAAEVELPPAPVAIAPKPPATNANNPVSTAQVLPVEAPAPAMAGVAEPAAIASASTRPLAPISISHSFGLVVKDKDAATPASPPQITASVGINPRGRRAQPSAAPAALPPVDLETLAILQPTVLDASMDGTATAAALLADTEPAGSPLLAQRSSARRAVNRPWSYISLGGNFGFNDGRTELSDTAFAIGSKIGLTPYLSARPMALLGDRVTFLLPLTYDIAVGQSDPFRPASFVPYVGGGIILTTNDGNNVGPLVSGGIDVRVSESIVINTGINAGFFRDDTDIGLTVGIGYIFPTGF
ncbi:MAG: hypothetical protein HC910_06360 [Spirulinaceae cyanobacterium SM2_1_0]|nr:hypothetical protein [Spirulinaceae cyanobacterium SM2_1_0]